MKILATLFRIFVDEKGLESTIEFYEKLYSEKCRLRFSLDLVPLQLAQVGSCLIIAGSTEARRPFEATKMTLLVDHIQNAAIDLVHQGATILEGIKTVPTGWNMRVQHPDGLIVEYVEHQ